MHRRAPQSMPSMPQHLRPAAQMKARRASASITIRTTMALTCAIRMATSFARCATTPPRLPQSRAFAAGHARLHVRPQEGTHMKRLALALVLALVSLAAQAADEPDLIFRKSTVFHLTSPNDKLATYAV